MDLPEPDGPITAVSVPGRALNEILSSRMASPSTARLTSRTSRPPVVVAGWVRRTRAPSVKTKSTLPIVTTSFSPSAFAVTFAPLTNVPLPSVLCNCTPTSVVTNLAW